MVFALQIPPSEVLLIVMNCLASNRRWLNIGKAQDFQFLLNTVGKLQMTLRIFLKKLYLPTKDGNSFIESKEPQW